MAITNCVFTAREDLLTLGYHAKSGLASKTNISVIVFGANVGEKCAERIGRLPDFDTDLRESFRHNRPWEGEGGCRETKTLQCRADCGGTQAGGDGDPRCRPHPPPRDC